MLSRRPSPPPPCDNSSLWPSRTLRPSSCFWKKVPVSCWEHAAVQGICTHSTLFPSQAYNGPDKPFLHCVLPPACKPPQAYHSLPPARSLSCPVLSVGAHLAVDSAVHSPLPTRPSSIAKPRRGSSERYLQSGCGAEYLQPSQNANLAQPSRVCLLYPSHSPRQDSCPQRCGRSFTTGSMQHQLPPRALLLTAQALHGTFTLL